MDFDRSLRRISALFFLTWRKRGFWLRALVCYAIGIAVLLSSDLGDFDFRFLVRGHQELSQKVSVIEISQTEALNFSHGQQGSLQKIREATNLTDSFYWDRQTWLKLLKRLLKSDVQAIGITLFFGENIKEFDLTEEEREIFLHPRVAWSAAITSQGSLLTPRFSNPYGDNIGLGEIPQSADQVVRYFSVRKSDTNHISLQTIKLSGFNIENAGFLLFQNTVTINFRGPPNYIPKHSVSDVLSAEFDTDRLKGKVVFIGASGGVGHQFYTPLGVMNRAEIFANISENILMNQWISRFDYWVYALALFGLLVVSVILVTRYPQGVSFFAFFWIGTLIAAVSAWLFDQYYYWVPALTPAVQLASCWVVFVGYQGLLAERKNWGLIQEQKLNNELEQLKNNFVSLISHDLKTPIAKIQAITDQIMQSKMDPEGVREKLEVIRGASDELNRYIKTIINLLRVESRQVKLRHEATDVNELIEHSIEKLSLLATNKNIRLIHELEPMFSAEMDPTLIQEVINNLIENAIKYTPENGQIKVFSREVENRIYVEVKDSGQGIPQTEQKYIWQKFVRGESQKHQSKGSGLGLYLVKYFIELHGGGVFLKSQMDVGTEIGFWLPVDPSA